MIPLGKGHGEEDPFIALQTLIFQKMGGIGSASCKKSSDNSLLRETMELRGYCEASHSLASWDLKGKGTVLMGWSSLTYTRLPTLNFKDFS